MNGWYQVTLFSCPSAMSYSFLQPVVDQFENFVIWSFEDIVPLCFVPIYTPLWCWSSCSSPHSRFAVFRFFHRTRFFIIFASPWVVQGFQLSEFQIITGDRSSFVLVHADASVLHPFLRLSMYSCGCEKKIPGVMFQVTKLERIRYWVDDGFTFLTKVGRRLIRQRGQRFSIR